MANKDQVINGFKHQTGKHRNGSVGRHGSLNLFYENRILYSFGRHFPLALRYEVGKDIPKDSEGWGCGVQYLINGDRYSSTTTQHQNQVIRALTPNVQIPFSALREAGNWCIKKKLGLLELEKKREELYAQTWGIDVTLTKDEYYAELERNGYDAAESLYNRLEYRWQSSHLAKDLTEQRFLDPSNAHYSGFKIIHYTKDTWEYQLGKGAPWKQQSEWTEEEHGIWDRRWRTEPGTKPSSDPPKEELLSRHRLGGVLFKFWDHYFLSSFDELDRSNYFLCHIPGEPKTISEAYENLKPKVVKLGLSYGMNILRQGDWFFMPDSSRPPKSTEQRHVRLGGNTGTHMVTRGRTTTEGVLLVQGIVRHSPTDGRNPEHKRLKLGDGKSWWVPVKNLSEAGWGAAGKVD